MPVLDNWLLMSDCGPTSLTKAPFCIAMRACTDINPPREDVRGTSRSAGIIAARILSPVIAGRRTRMNLVVSADPQEFDGDIRSRRDRLRRKDFAFAGHGAEIAAQQAAVGRQN